VDRAIETGYRVWAGRFEQAFRPTAEALFQGPTVQDIAPEIIELKITGMEVQRAVAMIREGLAA
jgi:hypothetical protein